MASPEDVWITIHLEGEATPATTAIQTVDASIQNLDQTVQQHVPTTKEMVTSYRSLSWDLMLTGRAISIVNTTFLGGNKIIKEALGLIYVAAAGLRIYSMILKYTATEEAGLNVALSARGGILGVLIGQEAAHTASLYAKAAALAVVHALSGPYGWAILAGAGVALGGAAYLIGRALPGPGPAPPIQEQMGVYRTASPTKFLTGPLAGVTSSPSLSTSYHTTSSPAYSQVNIDMRTGPISKEIDVEKMLDDMATRIVEESRRRGK